MISINSSFIPSFSSFNIFKFSFIFSILFFNSFWLFNITDSLALYTSISLIKSFIFSFSISFSLLIEISFISSGDNILLLISSNLYFNKGYLISFLFNDSISFWYSFNFISKLFIWFFWIIISCLFNSNSFWKLLSSDIIFLFKSFCKSFNSINFGLFW